MGYTQRGPWVDGGQFTPDDANAFDDAIALLNGRTVVDLGDIAGAVTIDCDLGGVFRANMTGDAALTVTNAATAGLHRTVDLMLSTNGYVPTFPNCINPSAGLSGDYIGVIDQFRIETAAVHTTPMVRHVADYGRYRSAFVGAAGRDSFVSDDGIAWQHLSRPSGSLPIDYIAYSKTQKIFVGIGPVQSSPSMIYGVVTSRDGKNWTSQAATITAASTSPTPRLDWNVRTGNFEFQVDGANWYESTNGATWSQRSRTGLPGVVDYDFSPTLGLYIGATGGQSFYKSTDKAAWTTTPAIASTQPNRIRWMDDWGVFLAYGRQWAYPSTDGVNWGGGSFNALGVGNTLNNSAYDGTTLAIPCQKNTSFGDVIYRTTDNQSWHQSTLSASTDDDIPTIFWNPRLRSWLVWLWNTGIVQTSPDANTWSSPVTVGLSGVHPYVMACGD